jgi:hypothetical protein
VQKFQYFKERTRFNRSVKGDDQVEDNQTMLKLEDVKDNVRSAIRYNQEVGRSRLITIRFVLIRQKG